MVYEKSHTILNKMEILKNARISMMTDYKNTILLCDRLRNTRKYLNRYQHDALCYLEYVARLQLEHGVDIYANEKSKLILDSTASIDSLGLNYFLDGDVKISVDDIGRVMMIVDLSEWVAREIYYVDSEKRLLDFCKSYIQIYEREFSAVYYEDSNWYSGNLRLIDGEPDEIQMAYILHIEGKLDKIQLNYLLQIMDYKYFAYEQAFEIASTPVNEALEKIKTDNSHSSSDEATN